MRKRLPGLVLAISAFFSVIAQDSLAGLYTPICIGAWTPYQIPGDTFSVVGGKAGIYVACEDLLGIDFGIITKVRNSVTGIQFGFIGNQADVSASGIQFGFICNQVGRDSPVRDEYFTGARMGAINLCFGVSKGVELGAFNYSKNQMSGVQFGFFNITHTMKGVQFGIANVAEKLYGLQIGIINTDDSGRWLPLANVGW